MSAVLSPAVRAVPASHHRVVPPGEQGDPVLLLPQLPAHVGPGSLNLALQHDDDGPLGDLQQVQQPLPAHTGNSRSTSRQPQLWYTLQCGTPVSQRHCAGISKLPPSLFHHNALKLQKYCMCIRQIRPVSVGY